jgi:antirestriction protein ArdC
MDEKDVFSEMSRQPLAGRMTVTAIAPFWLSTVMRPPMDSSVTPAKEELIAEMTAAMLCGIARVEQKTLENSAAYLKTWISRLKSDSRLLVSAASQAQKAADFIQGNAAHQTTEAQDA